MLFRKRKIVSSVCPKTGNRPICFRKYPWLIWLFPIVGLASLIWFLIRVVPKPSRATYPCQRIAFPLASGFIIWLFGLGSSAVAFRKARNSLSGSRYLIGVLYIIVSIGCIWFTLPLTSQKQLKAADPHPVNDPIGVARGIHPGRVVWVHDPNATDWEGPDMHDGYWWQNNNTDQAVVDKMMSEAILLLTGQANEEAAWDAIFRYFNQSGGKENVGYQFGEKITIKVNMVAVSNVDGAGNQIAHLHWVNTSPQMILALLRQLVNVVGVAESDITVGDTTQFFPNHYWDHCHTEFPNVHYLANNGNLSRRGPVSSNGKNCEVPFYWSDPVAGSKRQDYLPVSYAEATYLINFACLKGHSSGVTLCAKNHYGSFIRLPPAAGYYDLHLSLPNPQWSPGTGHYRAHIDITGHPHLGGKTLLYLIDGLYGGYYWEGMPFRWYMEPFGGDWPSSLFASQDPVAIDSVAYDFLLQEWPDIVTGGTGASGSLEGGAEDYLHEAALAYNPPSGTFYDPNNDGIGLASLGVHEHWNNPVDKQYSRNLETGDGIELVIPSFATVDGPIENVTNGIRYDYFRYAIGEANPGDQIVVSPGIYNEPINFDGKNLTISSTDPSDLAMVAATVIEGGNQAVTFAGGEDVNCVLAGFTITGAVTGIYCSGASPTIANCCISANAGSGIRLSQSSNPTIANCNISGNAGCGITMNKHTQGRYILYNHATISNCVITANNQDGIMGGMPSITNCTIAVNFHHGVSCIKPMITNSIIYLNSLGSDFVQIESNFATVTYTDIQGGWPGEGNIDTDPYFVAIGFLDTNGTPENLDDDFWVEGDYHLQSQAGRWDPVSQTWIQDVVTSSCIDSGNPGSDWTAEPQPSGGRINMGAYGGTAKASKSPTD